MGNLFKNKYSILSYIFIACIAFIVVFFTLPNVLLDTDYMWHIKIGEYIFINKTVPKTNVFGYFDDLKFFAHEWLFDLIIYVLYYLLGNIGVLSFVFINVYIMSILFKKLIFKRTNSILFSTLCSIISIFLFSDFIVARPQIFSYMLFTLTIYLLVNNFDNLHKKFIYFVIILILIVNAHAGSYPAFFAILGLYIACMFLQKVLDYDKNISLSLDNLTLKKYTLFIYNKYLKGAVEYTKIPILVMIALLPFVIINPYGLEIYTYPFKVMLDSSTLYYIMEWAPTKFIGSNKILLLTIIFILIRIACSSRKNRLRDGLFILAFLIMSCTHIRHLSLLCISLFTFGCVYIYDFIIVFKDKLFSILFDNKISIALKESNFINLIYFIIFIFIIYIATYFISDSEYNFKKLESGEYPLEIMEYIKENDFDFDNNVLFNDYNYGGYLIRNDIKVFIDGRADVYMKSVNGVRDIFGEYMKVIFKFDNWEDYFNENNVKYILLDKNKSFTKLLKSSPKIKVLLEDDVAIFAEYIK